MNVCLLKHGLHPVGNIGAAFRYEMRNKKLVSYSPKRKIYLDATRKITTLPLLKSFIIYIMDIQHDETKKKFWIQVDGYTAHVAYEIYDRRLDIRHTIVPEEIGGRGIASALVKTAYDYALNQSLKPVATCSYAVTWLKRHPEYDGETGSDYGGSGTCAL